MKKPALAVFCALSLLFSACGAELSAPYNRPSSTPEENFSPPAQISSASAAEEYTSAPEYSGTASPADSVPASSNSGDFFNALPPVSAESGAQSDAGSGTLPLPEGESHPASAIADSEVAETPPSEISTFAVNSSCFSALGYDEASQTLVVVFRDSGAKYAYSGFSPADYAALLAAPSLGKWFNSEIKGRFPCEALN